MCISNIDYESMNPKEYMEKRLDNQIDWFDKKSSANQKKYKRLKKAETFLTLSLPVVGLSPFWDYSYTKFFLVFIGAVSAYLGCWSHIETYYELWYKYRTTCELLIREKNLYQTHTGIYENSPNQFHLLVSHVENILSTVDNQWNALVQTIPNTLSAHQGSTNS